MGVSVCIDLYIYIYFYIDAKSLTSVLPFPCSTPFDTLYLGCQEISMVVICCHNAIMFS